VLMHWLRGSGLAGLRGMLPLTPLEDYRLLDGPSPPAALRLVRPLLEVTRADILAYCDENGLQPRFDLSNLDTTYFRNWLRHEVFPLLARHNPNVREVIRRSARVVADDYALLRSLLEQAWPRVVLEEYPASLPSATGTEEGSIVLGRAAWRALPASLQRATLREAIHRLRRSLRNVNFVHVENALLVARDGATGNQATLPQGLMLTVEYDRLTVAGAGAGQALPDWPLLPAGSGPLEVAVPGDTRLPREALDSAAEVPLPSGWLLRADAVDRAVLPPVWEDNADPWRAFLDAEAVGKQLALRTRRPGDRFQPLGLGGHAVKLADFLTNRKLLHAARDRLPLLTGEGGIAWVCGLRVDERVQVRETTGRVLILRFLRE
jgi:tRNA(Ile)-lysidine synthase